MDNFLLLSDTVRRSWEMIGKPGHVLVAFSGGADSAALLLSLRRLNRLQDGIPRILAVHVDHNLRAASADDAKAARMLCKRLQIPFRCAHVHPDTASEDAARKARYEALYAIAAEQHCDVIALGHHLHDQSETLLLRLMRGTADGLKGMAEFTKDPEKTPLWRPLLFTEPDVIRKALPEVNVPWQEDETNQDTKYLRNHLRHCVLPLLRKRAPHLDVHMAQTALILQDESNLLRSMAEDFLSRHASVVLPCPFIASDAFSRQHTALKRRIIKCFLDRFCLTDALTFAHIDTCSRILPGETVNLPQGCMLYHSPSRIHLVLPSAFSHSIPQLVEMPFASGCSDGKTIQSIPKSVYEGVCLRFRRPGDYIIPFGMTGQKSLQDYLTDRKVDRPFRDHLPLLCKGSEVLWVIGVGASEKMRALPDPQMNILLHYPGKLIMEIPHHTTKEF